MVLFRSLKITEIAAEAGRLNAPKMLSRTILANTIVRKTSTTLRKENWVGTNMLSSVTLTTLSENNELTTTFIVVISITASCGVVPELMVEPRKPVVLPEILIMRLK